MSTAGTGNSQQDPLPSDRVSDQHGTPGDLPVPPAPLDTGSTPTVSNVQDAPRSESGNIDNPSTKGDANVLGQTERPKGKEPSGDTTPVSKPAPSGSSPSHDAASALEKSLLDITFRCKVQDDPEPD